MAASHSAIVTFPYTGGGGRNVPCGPPPGLGESLAMLGVVLLMIGVMVLLLVVSVRRFERRERDRQRIRAAKELWLQEHRD